MSLSSDLSCQAALVTGADPGIGEGIAYGLAMAGVGVVVNYGHNEKPTQRSRIGEPQDILSVASWLASDDIPGTMYALLIPIRGHGQRILANDSHSHIQDGGRHGGAAPLLSV